MKFICPWAELTSVSTFPYNFKIRKSWQLPSSSNSNQLNTWIDKCHYYWMSLFDRNGQGEGHNVENNWNLDCDWTITPFFLAVSDKGVIFLGYSCVGIFGVFQLLDLIITELKSHMTCYNSMPLIGWNYSIQTGEQIL